MSNMGSIDNLSISINSTDKFNLVGLFSNASSSSNSGAQLKQKLRTASGGSSSGRHSPNGSKVSSLSGSSPSHNPHHQKIPEAGQQGKPPYSYAMMIKFAIQSHPAQQMTLNDIYTWITENFPYYKSAAAGWKVCDASMWYVLT